ncbi:MAG: hypothetical protein EXS05_19080 [Planctomycetaceae bacterium]|nr:hypothetical protein [Planctomycetaceae bacterium]
MPRIIFDSVRCFYGRESHEIKPITLLVGENSAGKTTFLALARIAWNIAGGNFGDDLFNQEPFLLGAYDQIASFRGGKAGRAKSFLIGLETSVRNYDEKYAKFGFAETVTVTAQFTSRGSQPQLAKWNFDCGEFCASAEPSIRPERLDITVTTPGGVKKLNERGPPHGLLTISRIISEIRFNTYREARGSKQAAIAPFSSEEEIAAFQRLSFEASRAVGDPPYAFAPIRTRPERTYDPVRDVPRPEGSHVPMVLSKMLLDSTDKSRALRSSLTEFGKASGLFKAIEIKRKGLKASDPFQIGVKTAGQSFNLVDVGYGISQVLPIIVDVVTNPNGTNFLLQQPEVHLHPRAQAELGSFLGVISKQQRKRFVIETHSDYLIDRIRMDVRDKRGLTPDDVSILYFEREKSGVRIHTLSIDAQGNVIGAPATYRQFFLDEERRILGL